MSIDPPAPDVSANDTVPKAKSPAAGTLPDKAAARGRELVVYAILIGIGFYAAIESTRLPSPFPTGPGLVPMIAAGILVMAGVAGIGKAVLQPPGQLERIAWSRCARLGAAVVAYVLLLHALSFLPATLVGGVVVSESARERRDMGRLHRHWQELVIVIVTVTGIYLLFEKVLHTQLP